MEAALEMIELLAPPRAHRARRARRSADEDPRKETLMAQNLESIRPRRAAPWRASSPCRRCIAGRSTPGPGRTCVNEFAADEDMRKADRGYFNQLVTDICGGSEALDTALAGWMDRKPTELDPVERAVLWVGAHELRSAPDVPYRVVINEAVGLAKRFGATDSHKFVNAVLDAAARELRPEH